MFEHTKSAITVIYTYSLYTTDHVAPSCAILCSFQSLSHVTFSSIWFKFIMLWLWLDIVLLYLLEWNGSCQNRINYKSCTSFQIHCSLLRSIYLWGHFTSKRNSSVSEFVFCEYFWSPKIMPHILLNFCCMLMRKHINCPLREFLFLFLEIETLENTNWRSYGPQYISDLLPRFDPSRPLRSSGSGLLSVPRVRTKHGCYVLHIWNKLPENCKSAPALSF